MGRCAYFNGRLVVVQTMDGQRRVRELLRACRQPLRAEVPPELVARGEAPSLPWPVPYETPGDAALRRNLEEVVLDGVPFDRAVKTLGDLAGTTILIDGSALEAAGFDRNTPVSVRGRGALGDVLELALRSCSPTGTRLDFGLLDGCIVVTIEPMDAAYTMCRMYDVQDIVPSDTRLPAGQEGAVATTQDEAVEELISLIRDTIDPDSWRDNGGSVGAIRQLFDRRLLISQTWQNHRKVERLLRELAAHGFTPRAATTRPASR